MTYIKYWKRKVQYLSWERYFNIFIIWGKEDLEGIKVIFIYISGIRWSLNDISYPILL